MFLPSPPPSPLSPSLSGGNFSTSPEGNFTFTPRNASLSVSLLNGTYFGSPVSIAGFSFPLPSNQITPVAGQILQTVSGWGGGGRGGGGGSVGEGVGEEGEA